MINGQHFIDGQWCGSNDSSPSADLPDIQFAQASEQQVDEACLAARRDFREIASIDAAKRITFLDRIAVEIEALEPEITKVAQQETGLTEPRLQGELNRTVNQLRMFSKLLATDDYLDLRLVTAQPDRTPMPRPDLRLMQRPIGSVAVFGASNFPLAFSTAGGDTASALAAGCPVIVKGHDAHAGTSELVVQAIAKAIKTCAMPRAIFQMLQGSGYVVGSTLVNNKHIKAVGFTGSLAGGRVLYNQCHSRPEPIPFYGELGSINPIFCMPQAMQNRAITIAEGWVASLSMGAGQFCTNPGVVVMIKGSDADAFVNKTIDEMQKQPAQKMLTDRIYTAYHHGVKSISEILPEIAKCGLGDQPRQAKPALFQCDAKTWMSSKSLHQEIFGAAGIIVTCDNLEEMTELAEVLEGQLTITLQLDNSDYEGARFLCEILEEKAGRLLCNGYPTGVEVCEAMMHGGPYPASTDVRATSVGTMAINRWLRPVSYQNFPKTLLPLLLKNQ